MGDATPGKGAPDLDRPVESFDFIQAFRPHSGLFTRASVVSARPVYLLGGRPGMIERILVKPADLANDSEHFYEQSVVGH